jgi:hypothetical protein
MKQEIILKLLETLLSEENKTETTVELKRDKELLNQDLYGKWVIVRGY